jgi:hypothetical protein
MQPSDQVLVMRVGRKRGLKRRSKVTPVLSQTERRTLEWIRVKKVKATMRLTPTINCWQ